MNIVFLMDPLETIHPTKDTSLLFIKEAQRRGFKTYYLNKTGLTIKNNKVHCHVTEINVTNDPHNLFKIIKQTQLTENDIDMIFIRTDPPFDDIYLYHTWVLDLLPKQIKIINSPTGIRTMNEKVWVTQFKDIVPHTSITSQQSDIINFLKEHQKIVLKPLNGYGGEEIYILEEESQNKNVIIESITRHFTKPIIIQKYIPAASTGDKRILLCNGNPIGALLRVHNKTDHRNNFFAGGTAEATTITSNDQKIIDTIKPYLKKLGLTFVGIDIIGDKLIEINVTSPTCMQEMNELYNTTLEKDVFDQLLVTN
ncbi:glutathione synthase [Candidatus Marinamargulisbacteria bacterium SCGC AG-414-C22]|nr:glutathione synthase [Candidatus Marinamargulisbacteria bacterium SCGC AG-414-C22]